MNAMDSILDDLYRQSGSRSKGSFFLNFVKSHGFRFLVFFRLSKTKGLTYFIARFMLHRMKRKYGLEIGWTVDIKSGLRLEHPFNITINSQAKIGKNVTIYKGVTIGSQLRGQRAGVPQIGNNVFLGVNASVFGGIEIGDNVLIAANSYVNNDVPSNSIVIGNPSKIIPNQNATLGYIKYPIIP